jgi:ParB family chromosome partitioning protein
MNIQEIALADILVGDRLRPINDDYAAHIALSFEAEGQMTPIEVRTADKAGKHVLVFGAHRYAAAQSLDWKTIKAVVFEGDALQAELRQIEENLGRRDLSLLDRARFVARAKTLWEDQHPTLAGRRFSVAVRNGAATDVMSFEVSVAEKLGISQKAVQRAVAVAKDLARLSGDIQNRLQNSPLADTPSVVAELLKAAPADEGLQIEILDCMLSGKEGAPRTVKKALAELENRLPEHISAEQKAFDKFALAWDEFKKERSGSFRHMVREHIAKYDAPTKSSAKGGK